jgi:hypothetical protein
MSQTKTKTKTKTETDAQDDFVSKRWLSTTSPIPTGPFSIVIRFSKALPFYYLSRIKENALSFISISI